MTRGKARARAVLSVATVAFSVVAYNAFAIGNHYGKDHLTLTIEKIEPLKDGKIEIHYRTLLETVWWCPNGKKTDAGAELTFVRASHKHKPKVTYPRKPGEKGTAIIVVPNDGKPIFRVAGEKRIKVCPAPKTEFGDRISRLVTSKNPRTATNDIWVRSKLEFGFAQCPLSSARLSTTFVVRLTCFGNIDPGTKRVSPAHVGRPPTSAR